jgi:hypothetical protein
MESAFSVVIAIRGVEMSRIELDVVFKVSDDRILANEVISALKISPFPY